MTTPSTTAPPSDLSSGQAPLPSTSPRATSSPPTDPSGGAAPLPSTPPRATSSAPSDPVAIIHAAATALRRDHDSGRALALLDRLGAYHGPLAEEALALRIEAATARNDPRKRGWARTYLGQYPNGRYVAAAQQALTE